MYRAKNMSNKDVKYNDTCIEQATMSNKDGEIQRYMYRTKNDEQQGRRNTTTHV